MKKKKVAKVLAAALSMAMVLSTAGCGGSSDSSNGNSTNEGSTTETTSEASELTFWFPPFASGDDGTLDKEFWATALEPWAEEHNVDLAIEIIPWGNYEEKHLTGYSSGEGPDITYMYSEMIGSFIDMGITEPLDEYLTEEDEEHYVYLDKGIIRGKQYMLPVVVGNARILVVNTDIMEQAGVTELPSTWQDLVDIGLKVKEANLDGVMPFAQEWADPQSAR